MTGAIITQSGSMPFQVLGSPANTESSKGDFKEVFQDVSGASDQKTLAKADEKSKVSGIRINDDSGSSVMEKANQVSEEAVEVQNSDETKEVQKALDELKEEIMKTLSISKEELEDMMEMLGISGAELFTKESLTALVMEVTGVENVVEILTNEEAYKMMAELTEFAEGLTTQLETDFGISENDIMRLLEQVQEETLQAEDVPSDAETTGTEADAVSEVDSSATVKDVETAFAKEEASQTKSDNQTMHQDMQGNQILQNQTTNVANEMIPEANVNGTTEVSPQEIYDQISEYMRSNVNGDVSEVEMQLNPENLGRLQIRLSAKDGVVSAQFVTQNEVVKGVLETQLIQLKEQFEQQGVKVDAVEVTVAGYSFDQGLNRDTGEHAGSAKESRKMTIRRINLNEMKEEEEMTQDEQIAVEMMTANGSTVDYMA